MTRGLWVSPWICNSFHTIHSYTQSRRGNVWPPSGLWHYINPDWLSHRGNTHTTCPHSWKCRERRGPQSFQRSSLTEETELVIEVGSYLYLVLCFLDMWQARVFLVLKKDPQIWHSYPRSEGKCKASKWVFALWRSRLSFPQIEQI